MKGLSAAWAALAWSGLLPLLLLLPKPAGADGPAAEAAAAVAAGGEAAGSPSGLLQKGAPQFGAHPHSAQGGWPAVPAQPLPGTAVSSPTGLSRADVVIANDGDGDGGPLRQHHFAEASLGRSLLRFHSDKVAPPPPEKRPTEEQASRHSHLYGSPPRSTLSGSPRYVPSLEPTVRPPEQEAPPPPTFGGEGEEADWPDEAAPFTAAMQTSSIVWTAVCEVPWKTIAKSVATVITVIVLAGIAVVVASSRGCGTAPHRRNSCQRSPPGKVVSPYSPQSEARPHMTSMVLQLLRLLRICVPNVFSVQARLLAYALLLALVDGLLECLVPILIVQPLWTMVKEDRLGQFQVFTAFMMFYNALISLVKATANLVAMRAMMACRHQLVTHLHTLYMSRLGRPYYTLGNLDSRVDTPDARITNDVDLLMQFLFEFVFGGVMKPEAGTCSQVLFLAATLGLAYSKTEMDAPGWGAAALGISLAVVALAIVPTLLAAGRLAKAQEQVQACEARHRTAHAKCRLFAESVCFYAGEATEARQLDQHFEHIRKAFQGFAGCKLQVDLIQLSFYFGLAPVAMVIAASIVRNGEWTSASETTFYVLNLTFVRIIRCCMEISKNVVDLAKAKAMLQRIIHLVEVMDAFVAFDARHGDPARCGLDGEKGLGGPAVADEELCCARYYTVHELRSSEVVPVHTSKGIVFEHVDVYTPDGLRCLLADVNLHLCPGESCLIMGPSGIGKSSLLRVLGRLWPLFRSPEDRLGRARLSRPGPRNVFFLAQRPYLFEGTLREQLAYPLWDVSLLMDLTDDCMERLFKEANLSDVWEARKDELDVSGISWCDVLSLGEQQRLQFCRLFWHAKWHETHGDTSQGFFAVLDESSASMDTTSEMLVYQACCKRRIGFLSVAHRPTVIQFHSKVLHFEFDANHNLGCRVRSAKEMAMESAHLITSEESNNTELRGRNPRRSISYHNLVHSKASRSNLSRAPSVACISHTVTSSAALVARSSANLNLARSTSSIGLSSMVQKSKSMMLQREETHGTDFPMGTELSMRSTADKEYTTEEEEASQNGSLVLSPYSEKPEQDTRLGTLGSLCRLVGICQENGRRMCLVVLLNLLAAGMLAFWSVVFMNLKSVIKPDHEEHFRALGMKLDIVVSYETLLPLVLAWGPLQGVVKALANYLTVLLMIDWRTQLHKRLQTMYLSKDGRLYYTLNNLDMRVDSADQRITNDVDLLMQFLFEFFLGGVMKPDSGVLFKSCAFIASCAIVWMDVESTVPGSGGLAPGLAFAFFLITFLLVERLGRRVGEAQAELQSHEAAFRAAHAQCRTFAEGISFYGGEDTEKVLLDGHFQPILEEFGSFANRKFPMEVLQLGFYQGQFTIAMLLGGVVAFRSNDAERTRLFDLTNAAMVTCLMALNKISCQLMDFAKASALLARVSKLYEVMEIFLRYEQNARLFARDTRQRAATPEASPLIEDSGMSGCCCEYAVAKLPCGALVPVESSDAVVFEHVDVYTPDGLRLLLTDVNLRLEKGDRCLIMGPSGIGKSSLLRVLGRLWPIFRSPHDTGHRARFSRPGPMNVFFLAQRPYLFEGTLREQVAYPTWSTSLIEELDDASMARLLEEANLTDLWNAHKHELDTPGIAWADLLSLGEQQRLQFCRLFWHHEWVQRHRGRAEGFFAVLDESSASMDTHSEMVVYQACVKRRVGVLSVAHRPTVIQFHTKVLHFEFDENHVLHHRVRPAISMAREVASMLTQHLDNGARSAPEPPPLPPLPRPKAGGQRPVLQVMEPMTLGPL